jgi:NAD(P) transhydrogenase subunit beta
MPPGLVNLAYLVAAVCFILAFKGLAHPRSAVRGNLIGAFGMFLAAPSAPPSPPASR